MTMRWVVAASILLGVAAVRGDPAAAADSQPPATASPTPYRRFEVSIGYHYSSGNYGSSASTEIDYVPLVLTAELGRWRLQGTIPYLHIDGPPGVVNGPNGPIQTNGTADGLGDLLARVSYLLPTWYVLPAGYADRWWIPWVDLAGLAKFPTGSRSRGLGTGEFDFGFEGELTWVIGRLTPFATAGYRFLGSPPGAALNDVFDASAGATYRLLDAVSAGLLFDYRQASTATTGEQADLVPFASWRFLPPWLLQSYVSAGLASGSPDVGVGMQLGYQW